MIRYERTGEFRSPRKDEWYVCWGPQQAIADRNFAAPILRVVQESDSFVHSAWCDASRADRRAEFEPCSCGDRRHCGMQGPMTGNRCTLPPGHGVIHESRGTLAGQDWLFEAWSTEPDTNKPEQAMVQSVPRLSDICACGHARYHHRHCRLGERCACHGHTPDGTRCDCFAFRFYRDEIPGDILRPHREPRGALATATVRRHVLPHLPIEVGVDGWED